MKRLTDIVVKEVEIRLIPVETRVPLKFGTETLTSVTCLRAAVTVENGAGKRAVGWGETPLNVQWVWPSDLSYAARLKRLKAFGEILEEAWAGYGKNGHAFEIGHGFVERKLPALAKAFNEGSEGEAMPWLAALVCCSAFDLAVHDGYGVVNDAPIYETYNAEYMGGDLSTYLKPAAKSGVTFEKKYPRHFLDRARKNRLPAWHLVGGMDLLEDSERTGSEPDDGYPVVLRDWIRTDGLTCLKVKLRGNDAAWDYNRLIRVGRIAIDEGVNWLSADFNCTVTDPEYVNEILDRLIIDAPRVFGMILYVEQPFPSDLESNPIDVHSVAARKPLFMDESAHDWKVVRSGRELGWTGVALKTCKTQTGALLSLCWARAHGMTLMVQDLTNPMLAQIPHVLLAAHGRTIMGVETNAMQFYPEASNKEAAVHPGIYQRRKGVIDLSTLKGPGFGYGDAAPDIV